jgi:hypothetical protein
LKLAWGRQAIDCLGNRKGGFTYEGRDGDEGAIAEGPGGYRGELEDVED